MEDTSLKDLIKDNIQTTIQMMNKHEEYNSLKEVLKLVLNNLDEPEKVQSNQLKLKELSEEEKQKVEEEREKEYKNSPFRCLLVEFPRKSFTDKLKYDRKYYARFKIYYQLYMDGLNQIKTILDQNFSGIGTKYIEGIVTALSQKNLNAEGLITILCNNCISTMDVLSKELGPLIIKFLEQETPYSVMKKYYSQMRDIIDKYYRKQDFY